MSSHDIKTFTIQGGAEVFGGTRRGRKAKGQTSRKQKDMEGGGPMQTVMTAGVLPLGVRTLQINGYQAPTMRGQGGLALQGAPPIQGEINPTRRMGGAAMPIPSIPTGPVPPVLEVPRSVPAQQPQHNLKVEQASFHFDNKNPINGGGASTSRKVELRKPQAHRKVLLNPKKYKPSLTSSSSSDHKKTRKNRKITLGLSTLHKRVTRAKKIREQVKEIPLADLRKELVKRGLIKESSKAPESILRQIAADAQIVAGKGL
jgi:hypothetical protein